MLMWILKIQDISTAGGNLNSILKRAFHETMVSSGTWFRLLKKNSPRSKRRFRKQGFDLLSFHFTEVRLWGG